MTSGVPVGTVVSSLLDYNQFSFSVSISGDGQVPNIPSPVPPAPPLNPVTTQWVPADGRAVNGSKYHKITGRTNVPDFRGIFTRGINNFDPQWTTSPQNAGQLDPTGMRVLGSYQADAFASHSHPFTYREPGGGGMVALVRLAVAKASWEHREAQIQLETQMKPARRTGLSPIT